MILSIITPSYNQGEFIEETIQSILSQEGDFFIDYIIIDGESKDETVNIIKKYEFLLKKNCEEKKIDGKLFYISKNKNFKWNNCNGISYRWVSEKDKGQADAINKGIKKSFGEIISWLNSDDLYYEDIFKIIIKQNFKKYDFCYGNGMWISKIGKNLLPYPTFKPSFYSFFYQCTLCQPTVFFSRKVFFEIGFLSNEYYCGFDFEYWMRALFFNKKFFYVNNYLAKSRMYFENKSLANQDTVNNDIATFKNKYYKNLKLNKNKLKKFMYVHSETFDRVQKMNYKLKTGGKINMLFDATVILNDSQSDGGRSGIFFVAWNVFNTILNRKEINLYLYCSKNKANDLRKILDKKFKYKKFKIITEKDINSQKNKNFFDIENIDIYFSPVFKIPKEIKKRNNIIKYTIIYDTILLMFPEYFPKKQDWLLEMIDEINENDYYFAISKNTKNDFIKYVDKINPKNIKVTHLAVSENFYCDKNKEKRKYIFKKYKLPIDKKYVFSLCTLEPRKNLIMSVKSFIDFIDKNKINDLVFLLGGSHWDEFLSKLEKEMANFNKYKNKIIRVGYIDDEDLSIFYSFSEFFVYPSLHEGFGLPVLEAMKCGVPVITSNNSSLPEVIGEAGIMINPKSKDELIKSFEKIYFNKNFKIELSKKGLERVKLFSWEKTVDIMINDMLDKIKNKNNRPHKREKITKVILNNKFCRLAQKVWHAIRLKKIK